MTPPFKKAGQKRAEAFLDTRVSSKPAEPASSQQEDKAPRQRLQGAQRPNAKHWQSLVHTAEVQSGLVPASAAREAGRNNTQDPGDGGPPLPCKQNNVPWLSLLFAALDCRCRDCLLTVECAQLAYEHWIDATGQTRE